MAAFRRGGPFGAIDLFRLRQVAEFGLANALIVLLTFPLARAVADSRTVIRIVAVLAAIGLGSGGAFEWLLIFLLARPMIVFVLVLGNLTHD